MTNDFETKLADLVWSLIEPKIDQKLAQFRDEIGSDDSFGMTDDYLANKIEEWMRYHFDLSDYSFDITDYSFDIDSMVDAQVQYLAEDGDLNDWLGNSTDDDTLRLKVIDIIGDITVGFNVK
jgi:CYTH domain-containing protein